MASDNEWMAKYRTLLAQVGDAATQYTGVEVGVGELFMALLGSTEEAQAVAETMRTESIITACKNLVALPRNAEIRPMIVFALHAASAAGKRRAAMVHAAWTLADTNPDEPHTPAAVRQPARLSGSPQLMSYDEIQSEIDALSAAGSVLMGALRLVLERNGQTAIVLGSENENFRQAHDLLVKR